MIRLVTAILACLLAAASGTRADDTARVLERLKDPVPQVRALAARDLGKPGESQRVPALLPLLKDSRDFVRESAAYALGRIGDPSAVGPLVALLEAEKAGKDTLYALAEMGAPAIVPLARGMKHRSEKTRAGAAFALGVMDEPGAFKPFLPALKDPSATVRLAAVQALGETTEARGIALLKASTKDRDPRVRRAAAKSLVDLRKSVAVLPDSEGPKHTISEFPALMKQLKSPDPEKRSNAASALGQIGDPRAAKPLVDLLTTPDHMKGYVAYGVVNGYVEMALRSLDRPAIQPLQALLKQSKDPRVRASAISVLAVIPDPGRYQILLDALNDASPLVRWRAAYGLSATKSLFAVEPLIKLLKTDPDPTVRKYAALSLGWLGDRRAIEPLVAAIADKDEETRSGVTQALENYHVGDWTPQIASFLKNPDPKVRYCAIRALARVHDPRMIEPLIEELADPDAGNRDYAILLLGYGGDTRALPRIINALKDLESHVRSSAIEALGRIGGSQAVDALLAVVNDGDMRYAVIPALGKTGDPRAVEPLIAALSAIATKGDAAEALADYDDPRAQAALLKAMREKDYDVIAAAHRFYIIDTPPGYEDALLEARRRTQYPMEQDLLASSSARLAQAARETLRRWAQEQRENPGPYMP